MVDTNVQISHRSWSTDWSTKGEIDLGALQIVCLLTTIYLIYDILHFRHFPNFNGSATV